MERASDDHRRVLQRFVEQLNELDARYELIDKIRRKEVGEVFADLAKCAGVPDAQADAWYDEWREF